MAADANASEATPMAALLSIDSLPRRQNLAEAIEHLQPARMRAGMLRERLQNVLIERQPRRAANIRERNRHERFARPARIVPRLHGVDLIARAVRGRKRVDDALRPNDLLVHTDAPAIAERRIMDAPMKPAARPRIQLRELDRAAARRIPLHQQLWLRPGVEHTLARRIEHALDADRARRFIDSCGHGVSSPSSTAHRGDRTLRPRTAGSPPSSCTRP